MVHYLDDFFLCGKIGTAQCEHLMWTFQIVAKELGVPLAAEKNRRSVITFLGIELDTIQQLSRLPEDKLVDLRIEIWDLLQ